MAVTQKLDDPNAKWTTKTLQEDFTVLGFSYGLCVVKHKQTKTRGSLDFGPNENGDREYHSFVKG